MAYIYKNESAFDKVVGSPTGGSITVRPSHYVLGAYFSRYAPATLTELEYDDEEDYDIDFTQAPSVLDGAIDTEDIANGAVTIEKIHQNAVDSIISQAAVPEGLTNITETPVTITTYTSLTHEFISGNAPNDTFPAFNIDNTRVRTITPLYVQGSMRLGNQRIFLGGDGSTSTGLPCIQAGTGVPNDGDSNADGSLWIRTDAPSVASYVYVKLAGAYKSFGIETNINIATIPGDGVGNGGELNVNIADNTGVGLRIGSNNDGTLPYVSTLDDAQLTISTSGTGSILLTNEDTSTELTVDTDTITIDAPNVVVTTNITLGAAGPTITWGAGAPASTPDDGSLYIRTDGGSGTTLYVRETGAWVGK